MNITDQELETVIDIMERAEKNYKADYIAERNKRKWIKKFPFISDKKFDYITGGYFQIPNIKYIERLSKNAISNPKLENDLYGVWIIQIGDGCGAYEFVGDELYRDVAMEMRKFESTLDYDYEDELNYKFYFHSDKAEANIAKLDKFLAELQEKIQEMQKKKRIEKLQADLDKLTKQLGQI